jgi:small subunit ribosomal protein S5
MENLKDKKTDDILEKLVHINRITKVVKGGRRFGFSALVVVGNQAGKIGIAHAKAKQVPDAIKKANEMARRKLTHKCRRKLERIRRKRPEGEKRF